MAVALQGLTIAGRYYHQSVDSDVLAQYSLCLYVAKGNIAPLAGWTIAAAPYFFPDHALVCALALATGGRWLALPLYGALFCLALALLFGITVRTLAPRAGAASLWGPVVVSLVLGLRWLPGLEPYLEWLVVPFFHGGTILTGLAAIALIFSTWPTPPARWRAGGLTVLLFAGIVSDPLFLVQVALPLGVAMWLATPERRIRLAACRAYGRVVTGALLLAGVAQLSVVASGTFFFNLARSAPPRPSLACPLDTAWRFAADLWRLPGFALTGVAGLALAGCAIMLAWKSGTLAAAERARIRLLGAFVATSFALTAGSAVSSCYWQNAANARILFNVLVLPVLLLVALTRLGQQRLRLCRAARCGLALAGSLALGGLILASLQDVHPRLLQRPYPDAVAALDRFLVERRLTYGLADYWTTYYFNALSRSQAQLGALRSPGLPYFWNNTAYSYLDPGVAGRPGRVRPYAFVVANGLDRAELDRAFGPPVEVQGVGPWQVLVYDLPGQRAMSVRIGDAVRVRLQGRGVRRAATGR